jgi:hypothetical protein
MGKCSNAFFSETTNMIKAKLYMNVHWTVFYNLKVFCSDMKFKMAARAGFSLTLDPMGKMFQNASSLKPLEQLKPNCPGIFEFYIRTKNLKFVEDHPMNIHVQFGFNHICNFLEEGNHWKVLYKVSAFLCRSEIQDGCHHRS